jgi:ribosomal-protein-alanine N-acetyltransferase
VKNPFLIGPRVYLRPLEVEDAATVLPWFNDPEVRRNLRRYQPMNRFSEEEFIRRLADQPHDLVLALVTREEDRFVGLAGLHQFDVRCQHAAFGIVVGEKDAWGKGYGTEATRLVVQHAFETLNLNRVWLHVYEFNTRGIRAYEKVGFQVEGRLRQDAFEGGRFWDTVVMGVLREEWQRHRGEVTGAQTP